MRQEMLQGFSGVPLSSFCNTNYDLPMRWGNDFLIPWNTLKRFSLFYDRMNGRPFAALQNKTQSERSLFFFSFPTTRPIPLVSPVRTVHCMKITYNYSARKEDGTGHGNYRTLKDQTSLVSGDFWDGVITPLPRAPTTVLLGIPEFWASFSFALSEIAETEGFGFN